MAVLPLRAAASLASQVRNRELSDLADLDTRSSSVQGQQPASRDRLVALGVDGFRRDAATMMDPAGIAETVTVNRPTS